MPTWVSGMFETVKVDIKGIQSSINYEKKGGGITNLKYANIFEQKTF